MTEPGIPSDGVGATRHKPAWLFSALTEPVIQTPDVIEAQLAHGKSGPLGMAYDRAEFLDQRRQMMNAWADYLDGLKKGGKVVPLKKPAA